MAENYSKRRNNKPIEFLVFTEISKTISDYSNFYNTKLSKSNIHNENYNSNISEELTKIRK